VDLDELDHPGISLIEPAGKIPRQVVERTVSFIILNAKNQGYFVSAQAPMPRKLLFCNEFYERNLVDSRGKSLTTRGNYSNQFQQSQTVFSLETAVQEILGHRDTAGISLDVQAKTL
jgi:hypothetical protein